MLGVQISMRPIFRGKLSVGLALLHTSHEKCYGVDRGTAIISNPVSFVFGVPLTGCVCRGGYRIVRDFQEFPVPQDYFLGLSVPRFRRGVCSVRAQSSLRLKSDPLKVPI